MDRDLGTKKTEPGCWMGEVKAGMFFTDDLAYVRQEWLNEGLVPRANCRGYNKFNSITRSTPEGDCVVKQRPQFYTDIKAVMESINVPYNGTGIGKATLQAIEFLMKPKREETPQVNKEAYLAKQKYSCLLYTSPSPRDGLLSRMPSSA